MKRTFTLLLIAVILTLLCLQVPLHARSDEPEAERTAQPAEGTIIDAAQKDQDKQEAALEMLKSIVRMKSDLADRMAEKRKQIKGSESATEKEMLAAELEELDKQLAGATADF